MPDLNQNDQVIRTYHPNTTDVLTVERVTRTRAYLTKGVVLHRGYGDNGLLSAYGPGPSRWLDRPQFHFATPERLAKHSQREEKQSVYDELTKLLEQAKSHARVSKLAPMSALLPAVKEFLASK